MLMDFNVGLVGLVKSTLIVPVNPSSGNWKLPDTSNVQTSALAAGAAIRASAARTVADANLLVHKENNVCPPAKESDCFIDPPIEPSPGTAVRPLCAYTIN